MPKRKINEEGFYSYVYQNKVNFVSAEKYNEIKRYSRNVRIDPITLEKVNSGGLPVLSFLDKFLVEKDNTLVFNKTIHVIEINKRDRLFYYLKPDGSKNYVKTQYAQVNFLRTTEGQRKQIPAFLSFPSHFNSSPDNFILLSHANILSKNQQSIFNPFGDEISLVEGGNITSFEEMETAIDNAFSNKGKTSI